MSDIIDSNFKKKVYNHLKKYMERSWLLSIWHFFSSIIIYFIFFYFSSPWLAPIFALVFIRTFIVFHDLAHNAFFPSTKCNKIGGVILGTLVFTPYTFWIRGHTYHHTHSNKLNVPQHGQTAAWDINKYMKASEYRKLLYKLSYGKYTLFTINPLLYFIFFHRFVATIPETIIQFCYIYLLYLYIDPSQYLYIGLSMWLAGIFGFMIFHIQHTFENVYRAYDKKDLITDPNEEKWSYFMNGMYGSSFLQLPFFLKFFSCNIQYHHIHHLNSKIPFYYLEKCHNDGGELFDNVPRVYLWDLLDSLSFSLYNNKQKKFENVYNY